jgi:hypothetical protein
MHTYIHTYIHNGSMISEGDSASESDHEPASARPAYDDARMSAITRDLDADITDSDVSISTCT